MTHRFNYVPGSRLAFGSNHCSAFVDASKRLTEIACTAHEGRLERALLNVKSRVGRCEHFRFVNEVYPDCLEYLCLGEVTDSHLGHDWNTDGGLDLLDHARVAHPRDTAVFSNIGRDSL